MRDILLQVDTYAEPTSPLAIDQAVALTKSIGGKLSALATHIDMRVPDSWLAEKLLHVSRLAAVEESKSGESGRSSLLHFTKCAETAGVLGEAVMVRAGLHGVGPCIARHARTRDLCLVAVSNAGDSQRSVAEEVLFGSGRPLLVFHPEKVPLPSEKLGRVTVAWDGGRHAARAVADSISLLRQATDVRVLTVVGEKATTHSGMSLDLVRHLRSHGVEPTVDEVDGHNRPIGASLENYIEEFSPQLMVMGAYGSSKLKEFILGGATEHVLNHLRVPTILSH
jgi:nucleotide-binding universal stress UspA family protein